VAKPVSTKALVDEIAKFPYDFDPGTKWRYDNSGYTLLGYIVEKVSGQTFGDFLRETFFQPLEMADTGVDRAHLDLPHEAMGYTLGKSGFEPPIYIDPSWNGGDGSIYSTVEDLYRWNEAIFNGRVLHDVSLKAAFTPVATKAGQLNSGVGYGFGWFVRNYRGLREISHSGEVPGFVGMLVRLPDQKFTVAVLANAEGSRSVMPNQLAYQIVDIFLADKLTPPATTNGNVLPP
jgi:CubicO group peptidase (beta-lactamase class C family)